MRSLLASVTSGSALLHLLSFSAFLVAALVVSDGGSSTAPEPDPDAPVAAVVSSEAPTVLRVTLFGNVVGEVEVPPAG